VHIAFLTVFLGLVSGSHAVRLTASPDVAKVEILLDGTAVVRLAAPPWNTRIDLGRELLPHELVARGLDAQGHEVARASQWINLQRQAAAVEMAFEQTAAGQPHAVRLTWQNVTNQPPQSVSLTFDGQPLKLDASYRAELPASLKPKTAAVLSAEVHFSNNTVVRRDVALGGGYGDQVATELMAVPIWSHDQRALTPDQLKGWFTSGADELHVDAVDTGRPEILAVRDPNVTRVLKESPWDSKVRHWAQLLDGGQLRMVASGAETVTGATPYKLFDVSRIFFFTRSWDLGTLLIHISNADERVGAPQQLADAVAIAGLRATSTGRRRAVLLVLAHGGADTSRYSAADVRRYLAALHVPLLVWSAGTPSPAERTAWGDIEDFSSIGGLEHAFAVLKERLEDQRIVWIEGFRLPRDITLTAAAQGFALDPLP
jgi:hypothetical protein